MKNVIAKINAARPRLIWLVAGVAVVLMAAIFRPRGLLTNPVPKLPTATPAKMPANLSWAEQWRLINLPFSFAENLLTKKNCEQNLKTLLGCSYMVNKILRYSKNPLEFVPASVAKGKARVVANFGFARIQTRTPIRGRDFHLLYEKYRTHQKELADQWGKLLKENAPLPFEVVGQWVRSHVVTKKNKSELAAIGYNAYLAIVRDPHTQIVPEILYLDSFGAGTKYFSGYGVDFESLGDVVYVFQVRDKTPAQKAGLRDYDIVAQVNGTPMSRISMPKLFSIFQKSNKINLKVYRAGKTIRVHMAKVFNQPDPDTIAKLVKIHNDEIGYLRVVRFAKGVCAETRSAIHEFHQARVHSMIIDLRDNMGGDLDEALCMSGLFLHKGDKLLSVENLGGNGKAESFFSRHHEKASMPLVVLINARSASASEIFTGIMHDYGRALVMGERSFGKGTTQIGRSWSRKPTDPPSQKFVFLQTVGRYILPSGNSTQLRGIAPDVVVYPEPDPTAYQKFAMREEDHLSYLQPIIRHPARETSTAREWVESCDYVQTQMINGFDAGRVRGDYQLQSAERWADCIANPITIASQIQAGKPL